MTYEETYLWELILPTERGSLDTWKAVVAGKITGFTIVSHELPGMWGINEEISMALRIACSEKVIKEILSITADHFIQECVMCHKVSNQAIMGYRE